MAIEPLANHVNTMVLVVASYGFYCALFGAFVIYTNRLVADCVGDETPA